MDPGWKIRLNTQRVTLQGCSSCTNLTWKLGVNLRISSMMHHHQWLSWLSWFISSNMQIWLNLRMAPKDSFWRTTCSTVCNESWNATGRFNTQFSANLNQPECSEQWAKCANSPLCIEVKTSDAWAPADFDQVQTFLNRRKAQGLIWLK